MNSFLNSNYLIIFIILIIIFLDHRIQKKTLGVIVLHNNEHTLNKYLQFLIKLMETKEIHYQILIVKEKKYLKKRSTGFLFNLGYRHLPGFNNYLFIDNVDKSIKDIYKSYSKIIKINIKDMFVENRINYLDKLNGLFVSRNYFKKINGFSNKHNDTFNKFLNILEDKRENGNYSKMSSLELQYDIINRIQIGNNISKVIINYM